MTKKIKCKTETRPKESVLRVRVVKAPYVNQNDLRQFIIARAKALVI